MAGSTFLRLYEQLRAVWNNKDKEQPFVRGYLLSKPRPSLPSSPPPSSSSSQPQQHTQTVQVTPRNGYLHQNCGKRESWSSAAGRGAGGGADSESEEVVERWFTLLGHVLFYCTSKDSQEYAGAMLTDIFSPVMARVDDRTLQSFGAPETQQVCMY